MRLLKFEPGLVSPSDATFEAPSRVRIILETTLLSNWALTLADLSLDNLASRRD